MYEASLHFEELIHNKSIDVGRKGERSLSCHLCTQRQGVVQQSGNTIITAIATHERLNRQGKGK